MYWEIVDRPEGQSFNLLGKKEGITGFRAGERYDQICT